MKFDNLCKLVLNEKEYAGDNPEETNEFKELQSDMVGEPPPAPVGDDDSDSHGIDMDDDLEDGDVTEDATSTMPETREDQIEYLVKALPALSRLNKAKSPDELARMAQALIDDDLFETIYNAHEELMSEPVEEEDVPDELKSDAPVRGLMGDEPDVPGLTEYEKEQRAMDRFREEEEGLKNRED